MNEEWRAIPGYEGKYQVSSLGRVRSLQRVAIRRGGRGTSTRIRGHLLRAVSNGRGYWSVRLWNRNSESCQYVHRLVLLAFVGEPPCGFQACHNNGARADNRLVNLRWDSIENNHADKVRHGTVGNGERARAAKLSAEKVAVIRRLLADGTSQHSVACRYGVKQSSISDINTGRTWKHI